MLEQLIPEAKRERGRSEFNGCSEWFADGSLELICRFSDPLNEPLP